MRFFYSNGLLYISDLNVLVYIIVFFFYFNLNLNTAYLKMLLHLSYCKCIENSSINQKKKTSR